jgi:predicted small secreted protein
MSFLQVGLPPANQLGTMNPILISKAICRKSTVASNVLTVCLAAVATAAFAMASTSCATTKGFGRDVQKVGDKIERQADRAAD